MAVSRDERRAVVATARRDSGSDQPRGNLLETGRQLAFPGQRSVAQHAVHTVSGEHEHFVAAEHPFPYVHIDICLRSDDACERVAHRVILEDRAINGWIARQHDGGP